MGRIGAMRTLSGSAQETNGIRQLINGSWMENKFEIVPLDDGRLFHRLMRYWFYYMRHLDSQLIPAELRPYVNVSSDEFGE